MTPEKFTHSVAYLYFINKSGRKTYGFKYYDKMVTYEFVFTDFYRSKAIDLIDCEIHGCKESEFSKDLFLEYADRQCKVQFESNMKSRNIMFQFNKKTLDVSPFLCVLKNNKTVEISCSDGEISIILK